MIKENEHFTTAISSDLSFEKMVVNLNFGNNVVAILNCDVDDHKAEVQFLDRYTDKVIWTFDCKTLINALNVAMEQLKQVNS